MNKLILIFFNFGKKREENVFDKFKMKKKKKFIYKVDQNLESNQIWNLIF